MLSKIEVVFIFMLHFACVHVSDKQIKSTAPKSPKFDLTIKPLVNENSTSLELKGWIEYCQDIGKVKFFVADCHKFKFSRNGKPLDVKNEDGVEWKCEKDPLNNRIYFEGVSSLHPKKCAATKGEIFCLNHSYPNPEIISESSVYKINFNVKKPLSALTPDSELLLTDGMQFQLANFQKPFTHKTKYFSVEYTFPKSFSAEKVYLKFLENVLDTYYERFGSLGFKNIKVGVIRKEEEKGTVNGSPDGNLILFSRTAFKDPVNQKGLDALGINKDVADATRKLVIAHELSHFWFSQQYLGKDGWMVEGIPQYLGLLAIMHESKEDSEEMLKLFDFVAKKYPTEPIPNSAFNEDPLSYAKAYYLGPLAMWKIGTVIGHENFINFLVGVFSKDKDPSFDAFDNAFKNNYPSQIKLWNEAWRIK